MFETVLVATDGSAHAQRAVDLATELARKHESRFVIVHVLHHGHVPDHIKRLVEVEGLVDTPSREAGEASVPGNLAAMRTSDDTAAHRYRVWQALGERTVARAKHGAENAGLRDITTFIDDGDPATRILERADETQADVIVTGSRGLSDFKGLLLGSVSHKLLQLSKRTCLVVR